MGDVEPASRSAEVEAWTISRQNTNEVLTIRDKMLDITPDVIFLKDFIQDIVTTTSIKPTLTKTGQLVFCTPKNGSQLVHAEEISGSLIDCEIECLEGKLSRLTQSIITTSKNIERLVSLEATGNSLLQEENRVMEMQIALQKCIQRNGRDSLLGKD